jgi:hypothetical protein
VRLEYQSDDTHLNVGYSFDSDWHITPAANGTKLNIPILSRSLTFYANDSFGNQAPPQTVHFWITRAVEPTNQAQSSRNGVPLTTITYGVAMIAVFACLGAGLLFIAKKHLKRNKFVA